MGKDPAGFRRARPFAERQASLQHVRTSELNRVSSHQRGVHGHWVEELLRRTLRADPRERPTAAALVEWMASREEDEGERLAQHMLSQSTQSLSLQSIQSAGSMDGHCEAGSVDMASSGA